MVPMITRKVLPSTRSAVFSTGIRCLHAHMRRPPVPAPIPFVPDHTTFLKLIGRSLSRYATKFSSWNELFSLSSGELRERGVEPARDRRYLLRWREKYRKGEFGIGGDLQFVEDGVATLRAVELPRLPPEARGGSKSGSDGSAVANNVPAMTKLIINLPAGETEPTAVLGKGQSTFDLRKVQGVKLADGHRIQGPYVQPIKGSYGSVATLKVQEGLWEHRRGHKVDGGERRKAEVRFKRRVEERKKAGA